MLGKDSGNIQSTTTVELLVNPPYRIYYVGDEYEELAERLKKQYVYHAYLG